jgi:1,4-alpha-glucan branching enzyme
MGCELADDREWSEQHGLNWDLLHDPARAGVQHLLRDLNAAYRAHPALWTRDTTPEGFGWLVLDDAAHNTFAFLRTGADGTAVVCVVNFAAIPHDHYRIGFPAPGSWRELVNTDATDYGGSGVGNLGTVTAEPVPWHGQPASAALRVPPLGALWLAR